MKQIEIGRRRRRWTFGDVVFTLSVGFVLGYLLAKVWL